MESGNEDNDPEDVPVEIPNLDLPDIIEINDMPAEDYETLLNAGEAWGMRRRLLDSNDDDMRDHRQLRGNLERELNQYNVDVEMFDPDEAENYMLGFAPEEFGKELLYLTDKKTILNELRICWNKLVPYIYKWPVSATGKIDRSVKPNIDKLLIPLKILLCGNTDYDNAWKSLFTVKKRTLCGKMFKTDGIVYQCWTCSSDPTTVLCSECFMHSEHRNHTYRMANSSGGGFCDCGDVESWSDYAHCSIHAPSESIAEESYSKEEKSRMKSILEILCIHTLEVLTWTSFDSMPPYIEMLKEKFAEIYSTVVLNDEIHSYMEVTACLSNTLGVSRSQAYDLANLIDGEGRTSVCVGNQNRCNNMKEYIDVTMTIGHLPPISCAIMSTRLLSHQEFSLDILQWIEECIGESEIIREVFCQATTKIKRNGKSLLETILLQDNVLWKAARSVLHKILINSFIEPHWKIFFADSYIMNYPDIFRTFLDCPDESLSFAELSVQLLTTPSLATHLLVNRNGLEMIVNTFLVEMQHYKKSDGTLSFDSMSVPNVYRLRKTLRILADMRYLLSAIPKDSDINLVGDNILSGTFVIIKILAMMQGINTYKREKFQHVQNEVEWETAFNITMRLVTPIRLIIEYLGRKENLCDLFISEIIDVLLGNVENGVHLEENYELVELFNHQANCILYDIMIHSISVHWPLSRLLIGALMSGIQFDEGNFIVNNIGNLPIPWLFEHSLRVRVLMSQSAAGLWKRNGLSLSDQLVLISNNRCRAEMADRDLMALQVGASVLESNEFLIHVMNRFKITAWLNESHLPKHKGLLENYTYKQLAFMVEEFIELILQILLERYHPTIGVSDWQTMLQRDMIHILCVKSQAHNDLFKDIDDPDDRKNFDHFTQTFDEILNEIADVRKSGANKSQYILKTEYIGMFNPYFSHYKRCERNHAEQEQLDSRKNRKLAAFLPIPLPPMFRPAFANVIHILDCDIMLKFVHLILSRFFEIPDHPTCTEGILRKICHLLMLTLLEEKRGLAENHSSRVKFITNENKALVKQINDLVYRLLASDIAKIQPLKSLISELISNTHELTKIVEQSMMGESITLQSNDDVLASLLYQQQKQIMESKRQKARAAVRKAKVLAKMDKMKTNFIKANKKLYDETIVQRDLSNTNEPICLSEPHELKRPRSGDIVLFGSDCTELNHGARNISCILCQESRDINQPGQFMGLLCHRQMTKFLNSKSNVEDTTGIHINTCGHTMHFKCYQKLHDPTARSNWSNLLVSNYGYRSYLCLDATDNETLCPFCHSVCNIFIPYWPESAPDDNYMSNYPCVNEWLNQLREWNKYEETEQVTLEGDEPEAHIDITSEDTSLVQVIEDCNQSKKRAKSNINMEKQSFHLNAFVYTVRSVFAWLESENQNVYKFVPDQTLDLIEQLCILGLLYPGAELSTEKLSYNKRVRYYLEQILLNKHAESEMDLLEALFMMTALFAKSGKSSFCRASFRHEEQHNLLSLAFCRHVANVVSSTSMNAFNVSFECMDSRDKLEALFSSRGFVVEDPEKIISLSMPKLVTFLRICAFFYRSIYRLPFSLKLQEASLNSHDEYSALCEYMGLPDKFIDQMKILQPEMCFNCNNQDYSIKQDNVQLIDLPNEYLPLLSLAAKPGSSDLIQKSQFDDDTEESRLTFLCLHCGKVLASSVKIRQMQSGQMGIAVSHMMKCSGYSGIFMKIKDCMVIMLQILKNSNPLKVRGAMISAPYSDQYGETDDGLKRGYPLYLNEESHRKIRQAWLRQLIPLECSRYAHTHRIAFSLYWENF